MLILRWLLVVIAPLPPGPVTQRGTCIALINYTIVIVIASWWDGGAWAWRKGTPSLLSSHRGETVERERDVRVHHRYWHRGETAERDRDVYQLHHRYWLVIVVRRRSVTYINYTIVIVLSS